jgi:hypothetical protein
MAGSPVLEQALPTDREPEGFRRHPIDAVIVRAVVVIWAGVGVASLFIWRNFTVDDAFIGWRHGLNLVEHGAYAFNPPPLRPVEAATSPLYGFLSAVPVAMGVDVVFFFKLVSIVIAAAYALCVFRVATGTVNRLLFMLLGLAGPMQAIHLWSGLETASYVLLAALVGAYAFETFMVSRWTAGVIALLLVLTRVEGAFLVCAAVWLRYVLPALPDRRAALKSLVPAAPLWAPSLVAVIALSVWRLETFGSALPNTFAAKTSGGWTMANLARNGLDVLPIAVAVALVGWLAGKKRSNYLWLATWVGVPGLLVYVPADLQMTYALRFPYQLLWPIVIAGITLARSLAPRTALAAGTCAALPLAFIPTTGDIGLVGAIDYYPRMYQSMRLLGIALHGSRAKGTLVIGDAGQTPYLADWRVFDTHFLGTDAHTGTAGIDREIAQPGRTVLALYATGSQPSEVRADEGKYLQAAKAANYEFLGAVQWRPHYWFHIWVSPDAARDRRLTSRLRQAAHASDRENSPELLRESVFRSWWRTG